MSRVKFSDLNFGQKLYTVDRDRKVIHERIITGLVERNSENVYNKYLIFLDGSFGESSAYRLTNLRETLFFTRDKAQRYIERITTREEKHRKYRSRVSELQEKYPETELISRDLIGKEIMVLFEKGVWHKTRVRSVGVNYSDKKAEPYIVSEARTNRYLLSREGKNWKWWSKLEELKEKQKQIEKQIAELVEAEK